MAEVLFDADERLWLLISPLGQEHDRLAPSMLFYSSSDELC